MRGLYVNVIGLIEGLDKDYIHTLPHIDMEAYRALLHAAPIHFHVNLGNWNTKPATYLHSSKGPPKLLHKSTNLKVFVFWNLQHHRKHQKHMC